MQTQNFSGEELEDVAREGLIPALARTHPDYRGRVALQELGEAVTLSRSHWGGALRTVRTDRMAATAPRDDIMLFCVNLAGRGYVHQHDRLAELAAGSGVLSETRSRWEGVSQTEALSLTLLFSRELLPLRTAEITDACARSMDPRGPGHADAVGLPRSAVRGR